MDNKTFEKLVKKIREKNYIEAGEREVIFPRKNVQILKDEGFEMSEEIIEKLMDVFDEEKFEESNKKYRKHENIKKIISKPLGVLLKIIILLLFMLLIYAITPSLKDNSGGQDRDDGDIYQRYYK
jgi:hypothetical protein